jgi:hypothetical protein
MNSFIKRLIELGFKKYLCQDGIYYAKYLVNPFIRNCQITADECNIHVFGSEPEIYETGDELICIAHKKTSEKNLDKLLKYFDCNGKKDEKVRKRRVRVKERLQKVH